MSCDIRQWGPSAWNLIHCAALTYPVDPTQRDRKYMYAFLHSLTQILPCKMCAKHFEQLMLDTGLRDHTSGHLSNRNLLFEWSVDAHNIVNVTSGKPERTKKEALSMAMSPVQQKTTTNKYWQAQLFGLTTILIVFWTIKFR